MPRRPAPPSLRPFLRFTRFPTPALDAARRALDDEAFRARVVELADPDLVGAVAMLVLDRPAGWEATLAERAAAAASEAEADAEEREVQRLSRQLERTAERLAAAEARVDELVAERDAAKATREALRDELVAVRQELDAVRAERSRAVRELKATEERAHRRGQELGTARAELQDAREQVQRLEATMAVADPADLEAAPGSASEGAATGAAASGPADPAAPPTGPVVAAVGVQPESGPPSGAEVVDLAAVAAAVAAASRAAADLASSLDRAAGALGVTGAGEGSGSDPSAGAGDPGSDPVAAGSRGDRRDELVGPPVRPRRRHRRPTRLPGGVLDDTPEALLALARTPEMLLVVDGYNVAKTAWPDLPIATERERLVDGLADLQARTGVDVLVVFDGAEQPGPSLGPPTPRPIRVRFSPPDVEADDVIVALVADLPDQRPVTVVSSDRRVQRGAADGGANVAQADQLVALLRR